MRSGEPEQAVHQQPLGGGAQALAAVLGQQRQADLITGPRRTATADGLPASGADQRAVGGNDGQRRGVRTDEPVLFPAAAPGPDIAEPEPFEGAQGRWVGVQPVQEP